MKANFGPDVKEKKNGDWVEYSAHMSDDIQLKLKCNDKTGEVKSATYSTKLRAQLAKNLKNDPVSPYDD